VNIPEDELRHLAPNGLYKFVFAGGEYYFGHLEVDHIALWKQQAPSKTVQSAGFVYKDGKTLRVAPDRSMTLNIGPDKHDPARLALLFKEFTVE